MIPNCVPMLLGREREYVNECFDTGWFSSVGPFIDRFEKAFAAYVGAPMAVATCNGTAALHVALLCAGVGPGDRVLVPAFTFVATVNPLRYIGAEPVFVDAEMETGNPDPQRAIEAMRRAERFGKPLKAILPAHLYGHPGNVLPIVEEAARLGIPVIEDASEALGAKIGRQSVGTFGRIGCFSFNGNKLITSGGGGGMLVTTDEAVARQAKHLTTQARSDAIEYTHDQIGFNYRMTNLNAAFGLAQLEKIEQVLARKREIWDWYAADLAGIPGLTLLREQPWALSSHWMINVRVDHGAFGADRRNVLRFLLDAGIQARPFFTPIPRMPPYCSKYEEFPIAELLWNTGLNLPCSTGITREQVKRVSETLQDFQARNSL